MESNTPSLNGTFELDRGRSAVDQIYDYLRLRIVTLDFKPGTILARPELAAFFNVSTTPIRDALLRLEEEGLVDVYPQHGTRVSAIDIDSARQAHFLRLALELEIARTLARQADPALVVKLGVLVERQRRCWNEGDLEGLVLADQQFHQQLFEAAGADRLYSLARIRSGNMDRLRRLHLPINGKVDGVLQEHAELVDAIANGDAAQAEDVVRRHLGNTLAKLMELRNRYPEYLVP